MYQVIFNSGKWFQMGQIIKVTDISILMMVRGELLEFPAKLVHGILNA